MSSGPSSSDEDEVRLAVSRVGDVNGLQLSVRPLGDEDKGAGAFFAMPGRAKPPTGPVPVGALLIKDFAAFVGDL